MTDLGKQDVEPLIVKDSSGLNTRITLVGNGPGSKGGIVEASSSLPVRLTSEFEGMPLTTLTYKGQPSWIAAEVGRLLGYCNNGSRLVGKISGEWANEIIEGRDFVVLRDRELADFKAIFRGIPESVIPFSSQIMLLFEPGLYGVCLKTNKPVGVRLRDYIKTEILPQVMRDGAYLPERQVVNGQIEERSLSPSTADRKLAIAQQREQRLRDQLDLKARSFENKVTKELVKTLKAAGHVSKEIVTTYEICAAEAGLHRDLSALKPPTPDLDWQSPTMIADRLGVLSQRVGRVITELGLRDNIPGLSKAIVNKAQHCERTMTSYLYSPEAVRQIKQAIKGSGEYALIVSQNQLN